MTKNRIRYNNFYTEWSGFASRERSKMLCALLNKYFIRFYPASLGVTSKVHLHSIYNKSSTYYHLF